jgi:hypothetical protein
MIRAIDLVANEESPLGRFGERACTFAPFTCLSQAEQIRPPLTGRLIWPPPASCYHIKSSNSSCCGNRVKALDLMRWAINFNQNPSDFVLSRKDLEFV